MKTIKTLFLTLLFLFGVGFTPKASAESTVYIIMNYDTFMPITQNGMIKMSIDGEHAFNMQLEPKDDKIWYETTRTYRKAIQKMIFNEEGRFVISFDLVWFGDKPCSDEITLDLTDGSVHYIQMFQRSFSKSGNFKILTEKEWLKKMKKVKDYTILPDYVYPAK